MAPSLIQVVGAAAVAFAAHASAHPTTTTTTTTTKTYQVAEVYDSSNFFTKFDFITKPDPNGGYVQYQNYQNAKALGLVKYKNGDAYIGPDYTSNNYNPNGPGRKSVRLESKNVYNHGLIIADFAHLPKPVCGSWPAYWFFGEPWPTKGEIDVYENWNVHPFNRHTAHVDNPDVIGECKIVSNGMTSTIDSPNCYDFAKGQWNYQGCSAREYTPTFGSPTGGIYAMQWTSDFIKIWDWTRDGAPADVKKGKPVPGSRGWGVPAYQVKKCDIDAAFFDMKMVLNIDFCGVAGQKDKWEETCSSTTRTSTCSAYVAKNGAAFKENHFKIKDIKVYQLAEPKVKLPEPKVKLVEASLSASVSLSVPAISSSIPASQASSAPPSTSSHPASGDEEDDACTDDDEDTSSAPPDSATVSVPATPTDPGSAHVTSTSSYAVTTSSDEPEMTTSTIYETNVHTITSCASTVTNCPAGGYVTTEIVSVGTTVCPVATETGSHPQPTGAPYVPEGYTTSIVEVTKTYTITACKPAVTNCPVGSLTTEVSVTTTVCPVGSDVTGGSPSRPTGSADSPAGYPVVPNKPAGNAGVPNKPADNTAMPYKPADNKPADNKPADNKPADNKPAGNTPMPYKSAETTAVAAKPGADDSTVTLGKTAYATTTEYMAKPSAGTVQPGSGNDKVQDSGNGSGSGNEQDVYVTATVVPVVSAPGGYNATRATTSATYASPTKGTGVVEVNAGVKAGVSAALMGVAAFVLLAM